MAMPPFLPPCPTGNAFGNFCYFLWLPALPHPSLSSSPPPPHCSFSLPLAFSSFPRYCSVISQWKMFLRKCVTLGTIFALHPWVAISGSSVNEEVGLTTDEEVVAQREDGHCLRSHSKWMAGPEPVKKKYKEHQWALMNPSPRLHN